MFKLEALIIYKKQIGTLLILLPLFFALLGNASCDPMVCLGCDVPPSPPPSGLRIEGYIDDKENTFTKIHIAYCYFPIREKRGGTVDNLKSRWYYWGKELNFETDVYYA